MKKPASSAFSLIEVVVALGLFSFCIVGILGLLAVAMGSVRSVGDESNAVHIASSIAGVWEVAPDGQTVIISDESETVNMGTFTIGPDEQTLYYDVDGKVTEGEQGATLRLEYEATPLPGFADSYAVDLTFFWPARAPEGSATRNSRIYRYTFAK
jgi:type II secretory pathway pseudopilin PulG